MQKTITLKKETADTLKGLTGSRAIEALHKHVNENGKDLRSHVEEAFQDLDNNTDTWSDMLHFLGALVDSECTITAPEDIVKVVTE